MSYTPTEWATGDVITAEKLNNMESGIAVGQELFIIHATGVAQTPGAQSTPVIDKTYGEIANAIQQGKIPVMIVDASQSGSQGLNIIPLGSFAGEPNYTITFNITTAIYAVPVHLNNLLIVVVQNDEGQTECMSIFSSTQIPSAE